MLGKARACSARPDLHEMQPICSHVKHRVFSIAAGECGDFSHAAKSASKSNQNVYPCSSEPIDALPRIPFATNAAASPLPRLHVSSPFAIAPAINCRTFISIEHPPHLQPVRICCVNTRRPIVWFTRLDFWAVSGTLVWLGACLAGDMSWLARSEAYSFVRGAE